MKLVTNVFRFFTICFLTASLYLFSRINTIRQNILSPFNAFSLILTFYFILLSCRYILKTKIRRQDIQIDATNRFRNNS